MDHIKIDSYEKFVLYFTGIAFQNNLLNGSIYVGDSWRIISAQRSKMRYPTMWLERPTVITNVDRDGDTTMATLKCALSIIGGVATDDWDGQETELQRTNTIIRQIIARLKYDSDLNHFDLAFPIQTDPLATIMADDMYGWRMEFEMDVREWTECFHADDWNNLDWTGPFEGIGFWLTEEYVVQ